MTRVEFEVDSVGLVQFVICVVVGVAVVLDESGSNA